MKWKEEFDKSWHIVGRLYTIRNKKRQKELDAIKNFIQQQLDKQKKEFDKAFQGEHENYSRILKEKLDKQKKEIIEKLIEDEMQKHPTGKSVEDIINNIK